jgi:hypothetical protein
MLAKHSDKSLSILDAAPELPIRFHAPFRSPTFMPGPRALQSEADVVFLDLEDAMTLHCCNRDLSADRL